MIATLHEKFPDLPSSILWKTVLLFEGVRFTDCLGEAVEEGAAPNYWPYRKLLADGRPGFVEIPYLFRLGASVARVRVNAESTLEVRRGGGPFALWDGGRELCPIGFVGAHAWQKFRTSDCATHFEAGVEQLGDMLVVNVTPGCDYFLAKSHCTFCGYGRYGARSKALGQAPGQVRPDAGALARLKEVLAFAAETGEARHIYIVGGSALGVEGETERYLPVIETARAAVGDRLRVTCGSGAVDRAGSRRFRDAGADSCCYNLEVWDRATFEVVCPGKAKYVGRERWIEGLLGAVEVFGWGNVGSAFVAGVELRPPAPEMTAEAALWSILEGATFLLDCGVMALYSPLWPVEGTAYRLDEGLSPELYLRLETELHRLRAERGFPVPNWLICPDCSYMLLEVDFDQALGVPAISAAAAQPA